jgi:hypothetical protein
MIKLRSSLFLVLALFLTSCNLYGGLSKPSDDNQYLIAARSCLDHGDYDCARQNYNALSSSYSDVAISEGSLNTLAQGNIFSIADLVNSLGSSTGGAQSFSLLADALALRGVTTGATRSTIKTVYDNDAGIHDSKLKAFSRFIAALAMFNDVLANAVGSDGKLTASDIVTSANVTACKTGDDCGAVCLAGGGGACSCNAPAGTQLTYVGADATNFASSAATWAGAATIQKLVAAATESSNQLSAFGGSNGFGSSLNQLKTILTLGAGAAGGEQCTRKLLIQYLSL